MTKTNHCEWLPPNILRKASDNTQNIKKWREIFVLLKDKRTVYYRKIMGTHRLATICNSAEESGLHGGGGGNKAVDCSRSRVLTCIACANDGCIAIDNLSQNHVHNKLIKGTNRAHILEANVAHTHCTNTNLIRHIRQCIECLKSKGHKFRPRSR